MGELVNLRNLDVSGTPLREMPTQIAKLNSLQTLSNFIVSDQRDGLKVAALGKFPHLRGELSISELQNVIDHSDASQANLEAKKEIDGLVLEWHHPALSDSNSQIQSVVLEKFQPSINLKSLAISGYGGLNFPNWLGDSSFGNMVYLKIWNCDNCSSLPLVGQLGNLKELFISRMKSVKSVGFKFYGIDSGPSFQPFPSLEILSFDQMSEWEEWNLIGGTTIEFSILRRLTLNPCPKLKGNIPIDLPSLYDLQLEECSLLVVSGNSDDNSNMSLSISDCENLKFITHESLQNYTSLEYLKIHNSCYSMTSFSLGTLPILKALYIRGCKNLRSILIAEDVSKQQSLSFLRDITIEQCNELESFSPSGLRIRLSIPNLTHLRVRSCEKLRSLIEPMNTLAGLQDMQIYNLPNLQSIAKYGFPINLRHLEIGSIGGALWNTKAWEHLPCLSELEITSGDIVKALMKMETPLLLTSLVTLRISNLADIECLDGKWLHHLTSLQKLEIYDAPKLTSFPEEGFPSSLSVLKLFGCPLLDASMKEKQGKEWRKIARIPSIYIDYKIITCASVM